MADQTLNPTSNTTPDPGQGGSAVSSPSNTGHGTTTASSAGVNNKTCLWTTFQPAASAPSRIVLKVGWSQNGTVTGPLATNGFGIDYSLNGGAGWSNLHSAFDVISSSSGTDEVTLSPGQDISQVRVRDALTADGGNGDTASVTASVSSIRLEVDFGGNRIVLGMM